MTYDRAPQEGSYIELDGVSIGRVIHADPTPACPGFPGCEFRMETNVYDTAVNVEVTGRVIRWKSGAPTIRVRVEFVGDCEPSTFAGGFLFLKAS